MTLILFYIKIAGLNLLIYGFANNNIASSANKNSSIAFWLGLLGPIGTVICLFQYIKPSWKKVFFGFGRFCFWAIGTQILGEIGIVEEDTKGLLLLFIGTPFILRGKNMFNYSVKKELDINKNIEPIKNGKDIMKNRALRIILKIIFSILIYFLFALIGFFHMTVNDRFFISGWFIWSPFLVIYLLCFSKFGNRYIWKKHLHTKDEANINIEPTKSRKDIIDINLKNEAIAYLKKGNEEFKNDNYKTAIKYYTKSIETFTDLKEAYKNRSLAFKKLNLTEKANKDYDKFLELSKKESSFLKRDSKKEKRTFSIMNIIGPLVCFSLIAALSYFTDISRAYFYLGILLVLIWAVFFSNDKDS
ncbi:hypothetical protein OAJ14_01105 [Polaribacter sp.]|nr:hypothetical protein [Polaribacter sp.]